MQWYLKVLSKYAVFSGRARRKEYWMFVLFNVIFTAVAVILDAVMGLQTAQGVGIIHSLYTLAMFIPGLAVSVRRLHDIGKSGFWILIALVPIVGSIWLLILMCTGGNKGSNKYGEDPCETLQ